MPTGPLLLPTAAYLVVVVVLDPTNNDQCHIIAPRSGEIIRSSYKLITTSSAAEIAIAPTGSLPHPTTSLAAPAAVERGIEQQTDRHAHTHQQQQHKEDKKSIKQLKTNIYTHITVYY